MNKDPSPEDKSIKVIFAISYFRWHQSTFMSNSSSRILFHFFYSHSSFVFLSLLESVNKPIFSLLSLLTNLQILFSSAVDQKLISWKPLWFSLWTQYGPILLSLPVGSGFVPSFPAAKPGHLTTLTSAWLTCKCMDAIFSKLQPHCEQLSRTWNSESGLKELLVVRCCYMIRVSQSFLLFHARRHENHLALSKLVALRKSFCGCL